MSGAYDWTGFYLATCRYGPDLLLRIDEYGVGEVIAEVAGTTDRFWSDGLEDALAWGADKDDLRAGVLAALELWRENVLVALGDDFGMDLDWGRVQIDVDNPLIDRIVAAAEPGTR